MSAIVLGSSNWHQGVIGIVASRISEMYGKPVFLISIDGDGTGKGSGRSVEGVDLHKMLSSLEDILESFGGHKMAAGITIKEERIDLFREKFSDKVSRLKLNNTGKKIEIDKKVEFDEINFNLVNEIERLSPYGIGNNEPVFLIQSANIKSQKVFKNKHLGITFIKDGNTYSGIWFNLKEIVNLPEYVDIVFSLQVNEWQGKKEIRFNIKDVYLQ
jgi:single-stranded-DNA-specific exonuclease